MILVHCVGLAPEGEESAMFTRSVLWFFVMLLFGFGTLGKASAETWSTELVGVAEGLVRQGHVNLTGDVSCEIGRGDGTVAPAYTGSDTEALLRVASSQHIYLFAHGFYTYPRRTKPPASYVAERWSGHLAAIRDRGEPSAACLFITDTAKGFGDQQSEVGNFLFALRGLTDDPDLYDRQREIVLIGYSAGVNYLKQGLLTYQKHLAASGVAPTGVAPTTMTIIFLGGVHQGAASSDLAQSGVLLFNELGRSRETDTRSYEEAFEQRWREFERSEREALVTSKGATQLTMNNSELRKLNRQFASALTSNLRVINIASTTDLIAPPTTTKLPFLDTVFVENFNHWDFAGPLENPKLKSLTERIYSREWRRTASQGNRVETR
jgi:hypothetical protein